MTLGLENILLSFLGPNNCVFLGLCYRLNCVFPPHPKFV